MEFSGGFIGEKGMDARLSEIHGNLLRVAGTSSVG
jgi:hypothetical protein